MQYNSYEVKVLSNSESLLEVENGYVLITHGTVYYLEINNKSHRRCNVRVEIDGKLQGEWRLNAKQKGIVERPVDDRGCFTFYRKNSTEGNVIGLDNIEDKNDLGLIQVTFTPEKIQRLLDYDTLEVTRGGSRGYVAGGTGLSGYSNQEFGIADRMELDKDNAVVISLRLVEPKDTSPRPLKDIRGNQVPPSVE